MTFLVPFVIWLASRPINDYISLPDKDKENKTGEKINKRLDDKSSGDNQQTEYNSRYGAIMRRQGAYIQSQGRYYN